MKFGAPMTRRSALKLAVATAAAPLSACAGGQSSRDAASDRVQGYTMGGPFDLCDGRIAERVWLSS
jgi:hypothetical protein